MNYFNNILSDFFYIKIFKKMFLSNNTLKTLSINNLNPFKPFNSKPLKFSYLNDFFSKKKTSTNPTKSVRKKLKKDPLSHLTKKQRKRIKMTKLKKIIKPSSPNFFKYKKCKRNVMITDFFLNSKLLIHDGYSWHLFRFKTNDSFFFKTGQLCFKTRVLSLIKLQDKGKMHMVMKQKGTAKIRNLKVKRKKR